MENFFCDLNYIDQISSSIKNEYLHEKICVLTQCDEVKNNLAMNLCKTNVIVQDFDLIKAESTKAVVAYGNLKQLHQIIDEKRAGIKVYYIFSNFEDFLKCLNIGTIKKEKDVKIFLNSTAILSNKQATFKSLFNFISEKLICFLDESLRLYHNNCYIYDEGFLQASAKLILFYLQSKEINIYNYNYFVFLLKSLILKLPIGKQSIVKKTCDIYGYLNNNKISYSFCALMTSSIYNLFLSKSNFVKFNFENSFKKLKFHRFNLKKFFDEKSVINSYLSFYETNNMLNCLTKNSKQIIQLCEKTKKLCQYIYKIFDNYQEEIEASNFIKAFSLASDFENYSFATLMRNMGYLNVI